ncbi:MAG: metG [Candidatus Nomurabacteria bacterium]|nr:metG [Candidatus Nomurabacteria bacterium]
MPDNQKPFYITTTLPYVNADPHVGFAMEFIRADVVARYKILQGYDVFFNTGTDEHGAKLYKAAEKEGIPVQEYVDRYAERFRGLAELLNITPQVHFIRTTDTHHVAAAQAFWQKVNDNGYIYKKQYQTKYCTGCELEKTDSEVDENDCCLIHTGRPVEYINEENYFFAYSKLADKLQAFYDSHPDFIIPDFRYNEMKSFLKNGLHDFSISRVAEKMPWGVPVPDDETQVMYVWFDALVNYISTLGWPENTETFEKYWTNGTPVQYCGKDNTRQQSSMWQAMLIAADLPNSAHIVVNGFINSGGEKMSKSIGNVINPYAVIEAYQAVAGDLASDVLRYYLLRHMNSFEDADMTLESLAEAYTANLCNGLGNLVSRIMKMVVSYEVSYLLPTDEDLLERRVSIDTTRRDSAESDAVPEGFAQKIESFDLKSAMDDIWREINSLDWLIQNKEPFKLAKTDMPEAQRIVGDLAIRLYIIGFLLQPFMPNTAQTILTLVKEKKSPEKPLFNRLDK